MAEIWNLKLAGRGYPIMMSADENTTTKRAGKNGKAEPSAKKNAKRSRKSSKQEPSKQEPFKQETRQQEPVQQAAPEAEPVEQLLEPIASTTVAMENPFADDTVPDAPAAAAPSELSEAAPSAPTDAAPSETTDAAPSETAEAAPSETAEAAPSEPAEAAPSETAEAAPSEPAEAAPVSLQTITNAYGDFTRKSIEQTGSFFEQLAGVRSLNRMFELQGAFAQQAYETFVSESRKIRELHCELTMQRLRNLEGLVAGMKSKRSS